MPEHFNLTRRPSTAEPLSRIAWAGLFGVVALSASLLITWAHILPLRYALPLMAASTATALPGVCLCARLYRGQRLAWLAGLLAGPAVGYAAVSLVLLPLWALGFRDGRALAVAIVVATVACALLSRRLVGILRAPALHREDLVALILLLLLVPAIVGRPFARVGESTPDGEAWRAYFTADFVWAVAVVAEVEKGDMPPMNPFRIDDHLHYYWLAHIVPTLEDGMVPESIEIRQVLLANAVLSGLLFVAFLYFFARHFTHAPLSAAIAVAFVVCCHSFEGLGYGK